MSKKGFSSLFLNVVNIVQAYFERIAALTELATLEAKLAVKSLLILFLLFFIISIISFTTWLALLFLIYTFLVSLHISPVVSASSILGVNVLALLILSLLMIKFKNNLWFPVTRSHLHTISLKHKGFIDEPN